MKIEGRISRDTGRVKDKVESNEKRSSQRLSVTWEIMSIRIKDEKKDMKRLSN